MQVINRMEGTVWFPRNAFKSMALRLRRDRVSLSHNPLPTLLHPFPNAALLTTSLIEHPLPPDVRHRPDRRVHLLRIWPAQPLPTAWSHRQRWHLRGSLDWHVCWHLPFLSVRSRHCRHHEVQQENSSGGEALKLSTVASWIDFDGLFFLPWDSDLACGGGRSRESQVRGEKEVKIRPAVKLTHEAGKDVLHSCKSRRFQYREPTGEKPGGDPVEYFPNPCFSTWCWHASSRYGQDLPRPRERQTENMIIRLFFSWQ